MGVYFITGKLGNGKTLAGVFQIQQHLRKGLPVATNIDIDVAKMVGNDKKNTLVYRLKDKPTLHDLACIGDAYSDENQVYDESKFGALIFDECATWFNSRTWNDSDRQDLINALVHIRKKHWNVYFIIQNISVVDKQARELLGEHLVFMRRLDNFKIPFVTSIVKLLTGYRIKMPKRFFGIVKYGTTAQSMTVDTWFFTGKDVYDLYDTQQVFSPLYDAEPYCVLPPFFTHGYYSTPKNWNYLMRLTKIQFRRFNKTMLLSAGLIFGALSGLVFAQAFNTAEPLTKVPVKASNNSPVKIETASIINTSSNLDFVDKLFQSHNYRLSAYVHFNNKIFGRVEFLKGNSVNQVLTFKQLVAHGWSVNMKSDILTVSKSSSSYVVLSSATGNTPKQKKVIESKPNPLSI